MLSGYFPGLLDAENHLQNGFKGESLSQKGTATQNPQKFGLLKGVSSDMNQKETMRTHFAF